MSANFIWSIQGFLCAGWLLGGMNLGRCRMFPISFKREIAYIRNEWMNIDLLKYKIHTDHILTLYLIYK